MKMRKEGRGAFKKYGTSLRHGGGGGLSRDDITLRKKTETLSEKMHHKKPPRLKAGRGAAAKRRMWKSLKSSSGWRKGSAGLSDTYRLAMSGDLRDVEKILPREDARYFRRLPRSQREKLLRKVEQKIERMTDISDWRPELGKKNSAFPAQRADGKRKTSLFIDTTFEQGLTTGRNHERGDETFIEGASLNPNQREVFFEGPSLNQDQRHGFFEGAQLDLGQAERFFEEELQNLEQTEKSPQQDSDSSGTIYGKPDTVQNFSSKNKQQSSLKNVLIAAELSKAKAEPYAENVPLRAHFQEKGLGEASETTLWEGGLETGADTETMTGRRADKRRSAQIEKRKKEELKKEISRRRSKETGKRRASRSQMLRRAYDAGAYFMLGIRQASLSGKDREDAERRFRNSRSIRRGAGAAKRTTRITARIMRLLTRFAIFAAPVLLPLLIVLLIVLLFSRNTRVQSEYLTGTAAEIYAYLRASDPGAMGDIQIAAILGNMYAESGLSPDAIEGGFGEGGSWTVDDFPTIHYDGTSYEEADVNPYAYRGYGLLMWAGDRANDLQARADSGVGEDAGEDRWNHLRVQLGLLVEEMGDPSMWGAGEYTKDDFYNAENVDMATRAFHSSFLMRGGSGPERLTRVEEVRIPKALEYYRKMLARSFEFAGNFGEMDAYGALTIPWFRMDVGLFDPDTMTWSHQEETGVVIVEGHPVSRNGCGICSAAMALSYCTGRMIYPSEIISNPCFIHNDIGEYQMVCSVALAASFGVNVRYSDDRAEVTAALEGGCPVLILVQGMAPNNRVTPGHYFLLTGYDAASDRYILTDPGGAGLGDPNCLTFVDQSNLIPGRSYVPSPYGTLYRQTFSWEELRAYQAGAFAIFGAG